MRRLSSRRLRRRGKNPFRRRTFPPRHRGEGNVLIRTIPRRFTFGGLLRILGTA